MPYGCCVAFCEGTYNSGRKTNVFPLPINLKKRQEWISAINHNGFVPAKSKKVCELHFKKSDFEKEITSPDTETGVVDGLELPRKQLKKTAVPSIFPIPANQKTLSRGILRKIKAVKLTDSDTYTLTNSQSGTDQVEELVRSQVTQSDTRDVTQSDPLELEPSVKQRVKNSTKLKVLDFTRVAEESDRHEEIHWDTDNEPQTDIFDEMPGKPNLSKSRTNKASLSDAHQATRSNAQKVTRKDLEWNKVICNMKSKIIQKLPKTDLEKQFEAFLTKYEGDNWRRTQRLKLEEMELNSKVVIAKKMLERKEWPLLLARKYKMLEFWKENADYAIIRGGVGRNPLKSLRLWQELTDILNNYEGQKRTQKEWMKIWAGARSHIRFKISKRMRLTDFEAQMADFFSKCNVKGYTQRVNIVGKSQNSKVASRRKTDRVKSEDDSRTNCDGDGEKKARDGSDDSDCIENHNVSPDQKLNLLAYWKHHQMIRGSSAPKDAKDRQNLWKEATVVLNNCQGPKKSWREWSDVWSAWKKKVKEKVSSQKDMRKHLDKKLAEYILETDRLTSRDCSVDLEITWESAKNAEKSAQDPIVITDDESEHIDDDDDEDINMETEPELGEETENVQNDDASESSDDNDIDSEDPPDQPGAALDQSSLQIHQRSLDFQEEILAKREELVRVIKEGFQDVLHVVEDCIQVDDSNTQKNPGNPESKRNKKIPVEKSPPSNNTSCSSMESEFDSFVRNVAMQTEKSPAGIASETPEVNRHASRDSVDCVSDSEEAYIIQIGDDDGWGSNVF